MSTTILLGTVALEPNRWGLAADGGDPVIALSDSLDAATEAGFDGLEVWEKHLTTADDAEIAAVLDGPLPVSVFNSYAPLDEDDTARRTAAAWAARTGATGLKFNTGSDDSQVDRYAERVAAWLELLPSDTRLICECHWGTAAEDPDVAARLFSESGPAERVQALVHLGDQPDDLRAKFEAHGDRITHVHVNFLADMQAPLLRDIHQRVSEQVDLLDDLGFEGSWTIEFSHGLNTDRDEPANTLATAADDLAVLRELLP